MSQCTREIMHGVFSHRSHQSEQIPQMCGENKEKLKNNYKQMRIAIFFVCQVKVPNFSQLLFIFFYFGGPERLNTVGRR